MTRISPRFRLAIAAKAILLFTLGVVFFALAWGAWSKWHWPLLARASGVVLLAIGAVSLLGAAGRGFADAVIGEALVGNGAKPLKSRRTGYSLRLPSGRFVEYVLYNPWPSLAPDATYTVVYGKFSGVIVAPPQPESQG